MTAHTLHLGRRTKVLGTVLTLILSALVLAGCASTPATGSDPADTEPPVPSPKSSPTSSEEFHAGNCFIAPAGALDAVNQLLVEPADSVSYANAWFDEEADFWIVIGVIERSVGENIGGTWATTADIASDPFEGEFVALDGGAEMFSTAPISDTENLDARPRAALSPDLKCENVLSADK